MRFLLWIFPFLRFTFGRRAAMEHLTNALAAHALYEIEHGKRQLERHGQRRFHEARQHGHYDRDQRVLAVFQRAQKSLRALGYIPPRKLFKMARAVVIEAEERVES